MTIPNLRNGSESAAADWLQPGIEQGGLQRYLTTLRARWQVVVACVVLCAGAAVAYVATAEKVYEATSQLLVTAVSGDDPATAGLGLIRQSSDPTRDVTTAAAFVETPAVARRVGRALDRPGRPDGLLNDIDAVPLAQSDIVSITAKGGTPEEAARKANSFAQQTVNERSSQLRVQLEAVLPRLRERLAAQPVDQRLTGPDSIASRINTLETLQSGGDPTIRVLSRADPPLSPSAPRTKLAIAAGLFAGLVLGLAAAFGMQALDPRLRREEQLRELFRLPVLARIPLEPRRVQRSGPLVPRTLSGATLEAYRTLRASMAASRTAEFRAHSVLITGSAPSEGKTTTAINFAWSLVQAGHRVILIEADLRRPTVGAAVGAAPRYGIASVLVNQVSLEDALVTTDTFGPDLQFLLVDRTGAGMADRLSLPTARELVRQAEALADYVVIDSPPLTEITDALPLAQQVEDVLIVARLGKSKLSKLQHLGELLALNDVRPTGLAVIGVEHAARASHYYTSLEDREETTRAPLSA